MKSLPNILIDAAVDYMKVFLSAWSYLPRHISYPIDNQYYVGDIWIPIGESRKGKHYLKIGGEQSHTYIVGQSGAGKSNLVKVILSTLTNNYPNVNLYLLDYKRVELNLFKDVKNCIRYEWNEDSITDALEDLYNLVLSRYDELAAEGFTEVDNHISPIVVVIEEVSLMPKHTMKTLRKIMAISRAAHVYIIFTTQRPSNEILDNVVKSLVGNRICLKTDDTKNSIISLGSEGCESLRGQGHAYYKANNITTEIQCYHIQDDTVKDIVNKHKQIRTSNKPSRPIEPKVDTVHSEQSNSEEWVNKL